MPSNFGGDQSDTEYAPHLCVKKTKLKATRVRPKMKKQAGKKQVSRSRQRPVAALPTAPTWPEIAQFPLALFHTTIGPIIGRIQATPVADEFSTRLWAPAVVQMSFAQSESQDGRSEYRAVFQPIALVDTYLDLSASTPFGRSPVPDALLQPYFEYFDKFAAGEYAFARVVSRVQQASAHRVAVAPINGPDDVPDTLERAVGLLTNYEWSLSQFIDWAMGQVYDLDARKDPGLRLLVKRALYGIYYDASIEKMARSAGASIEAMTDAVNRIKARFPDLRDYKDAILARSREPGLVSKDARGDDDEAPLEDETVS